MKIFIDTNIYLDFYRSNSHPMETFNLLKANIHSIVLTDQVIHEFERNREIVLKNVIQQFNTDIKLETFASSYLYDTSVFQELLKAYKQYKAVQKGVINQLQSVLNYTTHDPVSDFFSQLITVSTKEKNILRTTPEIMELALRRKQRGNPPLSNK